MELYTINKKRKVRFRMKIARILGMILSMIIFLSAALPTPSFALESQPNKEGEWVVKVNDEGNVYLNNALTGEDLAAAFTIDENGNAVYLNLAEYAKQLNADDKKESDLVQIPQRADSFNKQESETKLLADPLPSYTYSQTTSYVINGSPAKVTPDYAGPASITVVNSITTTEGWSATVSGNADITKKIKAGASFTWNSSTASSTSVNGTWSVPSGKTGYIQFTPYLNYTQGNVTMYYYVAGIFKTLDMGLQWGTSPKKVGGYTDGLYELKFK